mgnify:CR=1 FL=1
MDKVIYIQNIRSISWKFYRTITEDGEICARSNHVLKGYWNQPEATHEAIQDGWFRTGDGGYLDDNNYVTIADRKKDVIISGGENISSIEIEDVLFSHPKILEAAVVAKSDEKWGEHPCAFVTIQPGESLTTEEVIDFCRRNLAKFKLPKTVVFGPLEKTSTGKVQKYRLREIAEHV